MLCKIHNQFPYSWLGSERCRRERRFYITNGLSQIYEDNECKVVFIVGNPVLRYKNKEIPIIKTLQNFNMIIKIVTKLCL